MERNYVTVILRGGDVTETTVTMRSPFCGYSTT